MNHDFHEAAMSNLAAFFIDVRYPTGRDRSYA